MNKNKAATKKAVKVVKNYTIKNDSGWVYRRPFWLGILGLLIGIYVNLLLVRYLSENKIPKDLLSFFLSNRNTLYSPRGGFFFDVLIIPISFVLLGVFVGRKIDNHEK